MRSSCHGRSALTSSLPSKMDDVAAEKKILLSRTFYYFRGEEGEEPPSEPVVPCAQPVQLLVLADTTCRFADGSVPPSPKRVHYQLYNQGIIMFASASVKKVATVGRAAAAASSSSSRSMSTAAVKGRADLLAGAG